ncbi:hypothetical protein PFICI_07663 [Pestalotiopsis fici W106-1]|uniref:Uncharacterized protein n=1 Tax=Pestalotiopsis fici (strain W106-1 / CGMCC3.15140) TaxID=1229662 RepID=W3X286_PESFW|nr:uncharacterized protein PFICI_07663 [Pestalotiopsis fici W106-1]ETS80134.1 hypothetical protein PFICI_07663 [Pestalotiopsis fici W106-1]
MATATTTTNAKPAQFNLGPLTTPFVAPSYCNDVISKCDNCTYGWLAQTCDGDGRKSQIDDSACWPPTAFYARSTSQPFAGWGFYSPGTICPSGYTPSCSSTAGQADPQAFDFQFSLSLLETAVGCCPTGFTCTHTWDSNIQTCLAILSSTSIRTGICNGQGATSVAYMYKTLPSTISTTVSLSDGTDFITSSSVIDKYTVYAPLFQLVHKSSDLTGSPTVSTATILPTSTSNTTGGDSSQDATDRIPTSVAVGIGIGGTSGFIILLVLAYYTLRWKRKRDANSNSQIYPPPKSDSNVEGLLSTDFTLTYLELSGQARSELSAQTPGSRELSGHSRPVELANWPQR